MGIILYKKNELEIFLSYLMRVVFFIRTWKLFWLRLDVLIIIFSIRWFYCCSLQHTNIQLSRIDALPRKSRNTSVFYFKGKILFLYFLNFSLPGMFSTRRSFNFRKITSLNVLISYVLIKKDCIIFQSYFELCD